MRARGSTAMPVALAELGDAPLDRARVDEERPPLAAVVAEDHVLGDGERRRRAGSAGAPCRSRRRARRAASGTSTGSP